MSGLTIVCLTSNQRQNDFGVWSILLGFVFVVFVVFVSSVYASAASAAATSALAFSMRAALASIAA